MATSAAKGLRVASEECLARISVGLRWQRAEPEALVVVRELVSARSASVSIAEHGKGIQLRALLGSRSHGGQETPNVKVLPQAA
jgi:hypothetical protein